MKFSIFWLIRLTCVAAAQTYPQCLYSSTVDLTNQSKFENGSYVYQGVLIPPEKQFLYDKHDQLRYTNVSAPHLRGCVCNAHQRCIKLCCEKNEIFNADTFQCERISKDMNINWDLSIELSNGAEELTNVLDKFIYQVGVPCAKMEPLIDDFDDWVLLENGAVFLELEQEYLDTDNYCLTPYENTQEYSLMVYICPVDVNHFTFTRLLSTFGLALSVIFLIPTIVVYMILKELGGDLRGKMVICYLLSLTIAYSTISFINISNVVFGYVTCMLLGYSSYFFFMAAFLWLNVLCYDIWCKLKENNVEVNARENKKRFICYSLYAWSWSAIFTSITILADHSTIIDDLYKPGLTAEMCWIDTSKSSAAIYFYGPNFIISIFNLITFAYLTLRIYIVRRGSAQLTHKQRSCRESAFVILRLFLILGVPLFFDILTFCLPYTLVYMFVINDVINGVQGVLMFTLFVLNPNVLNSLKNRLTIIKPVKPTRTTL